MSGSYPFTVGIKMIVYEADLDDDRRTSTE